MGRFKVLISRWSKYFSSLTNGCDNIEDPTNNNNESVEGGNICNGPPMTRNGPTMTRTNLTGPRLPKELPQRYVLVFMGFLAFVNIYMMYMNLIVALPAMVYHNSTTLGSLDDQKGVFFENSEIDPSYFEAENNTKNEEEGHNKKGKHVNNTKENYNVSGHNITDPRKEYRSSTESYNPTTHNNYIVIPKDIITVPLILPSSKDKATANDLYNQSEPTPLILMPATRVPSAKAISNSTQNITEVVFQEAPFTESSNVAVGFDSKEKSIVINSRSKREAKIHSIQIEKHDGNSRHLINASELINKKKSNLQFVNTFVHGNNSDDEVVGQSNNTKESFMQKESVLLTAPVDVEESTSNAAETSPMLDNIASNKSLFTLNIRRQEEVTTQQLGSDISITTLTSNNETSTQSSFSKTSPEEKHKITAEHGQLISSFTKPSIDLVKSAVTGNASTDNAQLLNTSPSALPKSEKSLASNSSHEQHEETNFGNSLSTTLKVGNTTTPNIISSTTVSTEESLNILPDLSLSSTLRITDSIKNAEIKLLSTIWSPSNKSFSGNFSEGMIENEENFMADSTTIPTNSEESFGDISMHSETVSPHFQPSVNNSKFTDSLNSKNVLEEVTTDDYSSTSVNLLNISDTFATTMAPTESIVIVETPAMEETYISTTDNPSHTAPSTVALLTQTSSPQNITTHLSVTGIPLPILISGGNFSAIIPSATTSDNEIISYKSTSTINSLKSFPESQVLSTGKPSQVPSSTEASSAGMVLINDFLSNGNETNGENESFPFTVPFSIPCQTSFFVNCSFAGTYHIIDKKGMKEIGSQETDWITLRPLPKNDESNRFHNYFSDDDGENDDDSDEEVGEENEDDEKSEKHWAKMARKYNLSDHFKLINCTRTNSTDDDFSNDIQCISSHGIIKLNIVDDDNSTSSSSSSSSSSSEENEKFSIEKDKEKHRKEDDEVDDEGEDDDTNYKRKGIFPQRRHRYHEENENDEGKEDDNENEEENNKDKLKDNEKEEDKEDNDQEENENDDEKKKKKNKNNEEKEEIEFENIYNSENEKYNSTSRSQNFKKSFNNSNQKCDDSSEECEEDEEEEEDEEYDENELMEEFKKRRSKGLIRLNEKIPSSVCFFKEKVGKIKFKGYEDGEYAWDFNLQNKIIGAYYWGFLVSQIPAGKLSGIVGGKIILFVGVLMAGMTTLLTPLLAATGAYWLIAGRAFIGIMQGMCIPATQAVLAQWAPPMERTKMAAYTYSGIAVGAAMGGPLSAYLVSSIGWRSLFYGQGCLALLWSIFWFMLITDSPNDHPRISLKEKQYVLGAIGQQHAGKLGLPVPWCRIIKSRHVLALMLAQGSFMWAWHTMLHYAPRFIATVLHGNLSEVQGVWAAALSCMFVTTCIYGTLADWLRKSRKLSTESVRRAANSICSLLSAGFLVGVAQAYCNIEAVKVCFAMAIAMGFSGAFSGIYVNSLDLAPNHAAVISGICGAFATTANILSPYYWSLIVPGRYTLERWRTIWYTSAIFLLLANCLYFLLVGTKEQRWNRPIVMAIKSPKRREEEQGAISRRRNNYPHGIKNQAYASTEHL